VKIEVPYKLDRLEEVELKDVHENNSDGNLDRVDLNPGM